MTFAHWEHFRPLGIGNDIESNREYIKNHIRKDIYVYGKIMYQVAFSYINSLTHWEASICEADGRMTFVAREFISHQSATLAVGRPLHRVGGQAQSAPKPQQRSCVRRRRWRSGLYFERSSKYSATLKLFIHKREDD